MACCGRLASSPLASFLALPGGPPGIACPLGSFSVSIRGYDPRVSWRASRTLAASLSARRETPRVGPRLGRAYVRVWPIRMFRASMGPFHAAEIPALSSQSL